MVNKSTHQPTSDRSEGSFVCCIPIASSLGRTGVQSLLAPYPEEGMTQLRVRCGTTNGQLALVHLQCFEEELVPIWVNSFDAGAL